VTALVESDGPRLPDEPSLIFRRPRLVLGELRLRFTVQFQALIASDMRGMVVMAVSYRRDLFREQKPSIAGASNALSQGKPEHTPSPRGCPLLTQRGHRLRSNFTPSSCLPVSNT
jgi:hypothetical protein